MSCRVEGGSLDITRRFQSPAQGGFFVRDFLSEGTFVCSLCVYACVCVTVCDNVWYVTIPYQLSTM